MPEEITTLTYSDDNAEFFIYWYEGHVPDTALKNKHIRNAAHIFRPTCFVYPCINGKRVPDVEGIQLNGFALEALSRMYKAIKDINK
jgi:hypothetical protein